VLTGLRPLGIGVLVLLIAFALGPLPTCLRWPTSCHHPTSAAEVRDGSKPEGPRPPGSVHESPVPLWRDAPRSA
jgi:hypothetical protein